MSKPNVNDLLKRASSLTASELEALCQNSFLRHVPELMENGLDFEAAVKAAYERDLIMLTQMQEVAERKTSHSLNFPTPKQEAYSEFIDQMAKNIYTQINQEKLISQATH